MTDYDRTLAAGEQQRIQYGTKPATGWKQRPQITLQPGDTATIRAPGGTTPPPDPEPEPEPTPTPGAVGYGASAKRGTQTVQPKTLAELKAAVSQPDRLVQLTVPINLAAGSVDITAPAVTIVGKGEDTMLANGWLRATRDDFIVENVALWGGDAVSVEADPFNANGSGSTPISRGLVRNCMFLWGVDVTFVLLNNVQNVTVQNTIIAEGLYLSKHPEAVTAQGGHSMGFNCTNIAGPGKPAPVGVTFYRNVIANCAERNGRFMGPDKVDVVENLLYGWEESKGFHGAPRGINVVNNLLRNGSKGGAIEAFYQQTSADEPNLYPDAVYVSGNLADGFSLKPPSKPVRSTPKTPLSVQTSSAPMLSVALAGAGPTVGRGKQVQRIIADVLNRRSEYVNGQGKPNPYTGLL